MEVRRGAKRLESFHPTSKKSLQGVDWRIGSRKRLRSSPERDIISAAMPPDTTNRSRPKMSSSHPSAKSGESQEQSELHALGEITKA